jgi:hypothetical protein
VSLGRGSRKRRVVVAGGEFPDGKAVETWAAEEEEPS